MTGELAALAGLGALGDLNLQFRGAGQIFGSDAKTAGGDLLDAAVLGVPVFHGGKTGAVLATLAGVRLAADPVHGDGENFVGLGGKGAEGHARGGEATADVLDRLDLLKGNRGAALAQTEQVADGDGSVFGKGIDVGAVLGRLVALVGPLEPDEGMQGLDGRRGDGVHFSVTAPAVKTGIGQALCGGGGGVTLLMAADGFVGELVEADATHLGGGFREMVADELVAETDRLEQLAAVVARQHGDAHLRHDLQQPLVHGLPVGGDDLGGVHLGQGTFGLPTGGQFPDQVGADGGSAEADEAGEVVDVTAVAGVGDEGGAHAESRPDEGVMDGRDGEQHGKGGLLGGDTAIRKAEDGNTFLDGSGGLVGQLVQPFPEGLPAAGNGENNRKRPGAEMGLLLAEDGGKLRRLDHRGFEAEEADMVGAVGQPVGPGAQVNGGGHDELFADRVDRRVGDLGEELPEILVKKARPPGENGEGGVIAHRADRLLGLLDHGKKDDLQFLVGVAEGKQAGVEIGGNGRELARGRGQGAQTGLDPFAIGFGGSGKLLDVRVPEELLVHGIDGDHLPRA